MANNNKVSSINDAISVLVQGVNIAQSKGVYSFEDSTLIGQALEFLKTESTKNEGPATPEMRVIDTSKDVSEEGHSS